MATARVTSITTADVPAEAPPAFRPTPPESPGEMAVTMTGLSWDDFETIARIKGDRRAPRLMYEQGRLTLVSPLHSHEHGGDLVDRIIMTVCEELDIPCHAAVATLYRRRDLDRGIEGDRSYYLTHESAIRGKAEIDLDLDPPPDLAVEVEITHPSREALEIWAKLGVSEVWVYAPRRESLRILNLSTDGTYVEANASRFFPLLKIAEILDWIDRAPQEPQSRWVRRLRAWVRDELAPRIAPAE